MGKVFLKVPDDKDEVRAFAAKLAAAVNTAQRRRMEQRGEQQQEKGEQ